MTETEVQMLCPVCGETITDWLANSTPETVQARIKRLVIYHESHEVRGR
jgi:hypothetical protein